MRTIEIEGLRLSRIGLGTWQFGTREWGYGEGYARVTAPALVRRAAELGITMLDTAEAYGPARSERIIGETLRSLPPDLRAGLIVATKFTPIAPVEPIVAWQAGGSRRRLGLDAIDLLYVHWKNPFVSARRVLQAMRPLVETGVVRHAGVSNVSLAQWQEAEAALRHPVVATQVHLNLACPAPARDLVP
jgi:aryl-alcohol dehydrogenase-like predicted oxidoreductase